MEILREHVFWDKNHIFPLTVLKLWNMEFFFKKMDVDLNQENPVEQVHNFFQPSQWHYVFNSGGCHAERQGNKNSSTLTFPNGRGKMGEFACFPLFYSHLSCMDFHLHKSPHPQHYKAHRQLLGGVGGRKNQHLPASHSGPA